MIILGSCGSSYSWLVILKDCDNINCVKSRVDSHLCIPPNQLHLTFFYTFLTIIQHLIVTEHPCMERR